jgi:hypothetical protein
MAFTEKSFGLLKLRFDDNRDVTFLVAPRFLNFTRIAV